MFTRRNLPASAEPWGREVEARIEAIERAVKNQGFEATNALKAVNASIGQIIEQQTSLQSAQQALTQQQALALANSTVTTFEFARSTAGAYVYQQFSFTPLSSDGNMLVVVTPYATGASGGGGEGSIQGSYIANLTGLTGLPTSTMRFGSESFSGDPGGSIGNSSVTTVSLSNWSAANSQISIGLGVTSATSPSSVTMRITLIPNYRSI